MRILNFLKILVITFVIYSGFVYSSDNSVIDMVAGNDAGELKIIFKDLAIKNEKQISSLGLSDYQLNSIVYAHPSWVHNFGRFSTVREFVGYCLIFQICNI